MSTEVDVPNPDLSLIPGMYAEVTISLRQSRGALSVPLTAIDTAGETRRVMVIAEDGLLQSRQVSLGIQNADRAEVTSGLKEGELVVVGRRSQLSSGERVKPKLLGGVEGGGDS